MAETGPRTEPLAPAVLELMAAVNLRYVRLIRMAGEFQGLEAGEQLAQMDMQLEVGVFRLEPETSAFHVIAKAGFKFRPSAESTKIIASVSCDFALEYSVQKPDLLPKLTEENLLQFAALNGMRNAWPYIREYCQSTLARMQLPQFTLPSLPPGNFRPTES